jgi:hypothetical protein
MLVILIVLLLCWAEFRVNVSGSSRSKIKSRSTSERAPVAGGVVGSADGRCLLDRVGRAA